MRVVVTRPQASGEKTATLLRAHGHEPILLPLTEPVHFAEAAIEALSKQPSVLAVTSAEAIRALTESGGNWSAMRDTPLFAVGNASANAARKAGFENVFAGKSDGIALAQLIAETMNAGAAARPLTYLAGKPREPGFEKHLSSLNVPFETVEIYEMQPLPLQHAQLEKLFADGPIGAVFFYSAEAARQFFALMAHEAFYPKLDHCKFICISTKVLSNIPEAFQQAAWASPTPSEAEMFDLLDAKAGT